MLLISALCAMSCDAPREPTGGVCTEMHGCKDGLICYQGTCSARKLEGETCDPTITDYKRHCEFGLECSPKGICETEKAREARTAVEAAAHERELLRQSGVESEAVAELPIAAPAAGLPIRVVRTRGQRSAFAACGTEERLTGGGCRMPQPWAHMSFPSHQSEADTVGARWNCQMGERSTAEIEAFALCQALE